MDILKVHIDSESLIREASGDTARRLTIASVRAVGHTSLPAISTFTNLHRCMSLTVALTLPYSSAVPAFNVFLMGTLCNLFFYKQQIRLDY